MSGILHQDLVPETQEVIDTALGTTFREEGVISNSFEIAHNLLLTTSSGSDFLFYLLMIKHPRLALISLATIDISKYSETKNKYTYAKCIINYLLIQPINKRAYTPKEVVYIYTSHLDSELHSPIKDTVR